MCGVMTTFSWRSSGCRPPARLVRTTSSAAPPRWPDASASSSASSSTSVSRAVLTNHEPGFIFANVAGVEHVLVLGGRARVERDEVAPLEQVVERLDLLDPPGAFDVEVGVVDEHAHPERERAQRHPVTDLAVADEAERVPAQVAADELRALPVVLELVALLEEALRPAGTRGRA